MEVSRLIFIPLTLLVSKVFDSIKNISHLDLVIKKILMLRLNFFRPCVMCLHVLLCKKCKIFILMSRFNISVADIIRSQYSDQVSIAILIPS